MYKPIVRLHKNEFLFPHSRAVQKIISSSSQNDIRIYPDQEQQIVYKALSEYHDVPLSFLFLGAGIEQVLTTCLQHMVIHAGHKTLSIADPSWEQYELIAARSGYVNCRRLPQLCQQDRFTTPIDALRKMLKLVDHAGVLLGSPNNPTGHTLDEKAMKQIIVDYPKSIFILDEAYAGFGRNPYRISSFLPLLPKCKNLFILRSFSKFFGLAGLRIGYAIGNPYLFSRLKLEPLYLGLNSIAVKAATTAIQHDSFYQNQAKIIANIRDGFIKKINDEFFHKAYRSSANFVLVQINNSLSALAMKEKLLRNGFLIKSYTKGILRQSIRITIAPQKIMDDVFLLLKD